MILMLNPKLNRELEHVMSTEEYTYFFENYTMYLCIEECIKHKQHNRYDEERVGNSYLFVTNQEYRGWDVHGISFIFIITMP